MRRKLLVSFLIVLSICISIIGVFSMRLSRQIYLKGLEDNLISNGKLMAGMLNDRYDYNKDNYDDLATEYSKILNSRVTIIASDGKVIGESENSSENMENHSERLEVKEAMEGKVGISYRHSTTENMDMLYVAVPVGSAKPYKAVIRLSVPLTYIKSIQSHLLLNVLLAVALGLMISFITAYLFVRRLTKPINEMTYISTSIAQGRYDRRISMNYKDELGVLARSFNDMAEKLERTISDLSDKKNKLEAILKSMLSGVIAFDAKSKVMLANPEAYSIFGFKKDILGKHALEIFRNTKLEDVILSHKDEDKEIDIDYPEKRVIRVKTAAINDEEGSQNLGLVMVIHDITEIKNLENMRSEFVANVSHELKTPLTSIKGFAETLRNGAINDDSARDKFLDIINIEADRLSRLINDILLLSDIENKPKEILSEKVDVNKVIDQVKDIMSGAALLKNIKLEFHKCEPPAYVMGEHDLVKQLLINLTDNAVKYTPEDGRVDVSVSRKDDNVSIEVRDNGIGISKEHIPRLFERFYRVDKSRSRALGGTGLGLAIVKHIVVSMNGEINVESEPGKGSRFTVKVLEAK